MMYLVWHKPFGMCHTFRTQWTHQSHILSEGQGPASVLPSPAACQHNHPSPRTMGCSVEISLLPSLSPPLLLQPSCDPRTQPLRFPGVAPHRPQVQAEPMGATRLQPAS